LALVVIELGGHPIRNNVLMETGSPRSGYQDTTATAISRKSPNKAKKLWRGVIFDKER
jgi:hypothetical protein